MLSPQNSGLIQDMFRGPERGRAFGLFGATVGISTAVGPVLGGAILSVASWRWVFFVNVPIGLLAYVLATRWLPKAPRRHGRLRDEVDFAGIVLLGLAVLGVLLPLISGGMWWLFAVVVVAGFVFIRWERRTVELGRPPLLDIPLFTGTPGYASGAAVCAIYFCGFAGIWLVFAIFFQQGLGYSPLESGLAVTPFALGSAVSAAVAGRLVSTWGRKLTAIGLTMVASGLTVVAVVVNLVPAQFTGPVVALPLLVAGIGGGMVISPNITLTLECVPAPLAGVAGGALQTGQRIGTAIGTAVLAAVFHALLPSDYPRALSAALGCAIVITLIALGLALAELRVRRARRPLPEGAVILQD